MATFGLRPGAREDLKRIGRYSLRVWGRAQRDRYLRTLERCFALLAAEPGLGRPHPELRGNYRSFHEGRHLIFYREADDGIEIVRILYENMDTSRHFGAARRRTFDVDP